MKKLMWLAGIVVVIALVGLAVIFIVYLPGGGSSPSTSREASSTPTLIGLSLGTLREERWQKDADLFAARVKADGAVVDVKYSGEDPAEQVSQAEDQIIDGAKVLVVVPYDASTSAAIVKKAHDHGVKVIAYDRMIPNSDVDLFVTFDSRKVGELDAAEILKLVPKGTYAYIGGGTTDNNAFLHKEGAMKVLKPAIDRKDIRLALETWSANWQPEEAYKSLKAYLATGKRVDAVVAANDGTAGGAIRALAEFGLAGKVPVSGQDADLVACQRIIAGTQAVTIYKPLKNEAYAAADAAVAMGRGQTVATNGTLNNGKIDVPSYFLDPIAVTKANIDDVIVASGFHTHEEVYQRPQ